MSLKQLLNNIADAPTSDFEQSGSRRDAIKNFGTKVAIAALPIAIGSMFKKSYAQTAAAEPLADILNYVLEFDYLAYNYYRTGNNTGGLIPDTDKPGFLTLENQKRAHILMLTQAVINIEGTPFTPKNYDPSATNPYYIVSGTYDFTSAGKYAPFASYPTFVSIAEGLEDAFVHGYQGKMPAVLDNPVITELFMRLQSVIGRHASHVRFVRRQLGPVVAPDYPTPWITNNIPPIAAFQPYYNGEETIGQRNIDITALPGVDGNISATDAASAFDEPFDPKFIAGFLSQFKL